MGLLLGEGLYDLCLDAIHMLTARFVDVDDDAAFILFLDFGGQQVAESFKTCWFFFVALHFSLDE